MPASLLVNQEEGSVQTTDSRGSVPEKGRRKETLFFCLHYEFQINYFMKQNPSSTT
jgi:hypothetical protein